MQERRWRRGSDFGPEYGHFICVSPWSLDTIWSFSRRFPAPPFPGSGLLIQSPSNAPFDCLATAIWIHSHIPPTASAPGTPQGATPLLSKSAKSVNLATPSLFSLIPQGIYMTMRKRRRHRAKNGCISLLAWLATCGWLGTWPWGHGFFAFCGQLLWNKQASQATAREHYT